MTDYARDYELREPLLHCWCEYKLVQPLLKDNTLKDQTSPNTTMYRKVVSSWGSRYSSESSHNIKMKLLPYIFLFML